MSERKDLTRWNRAGLTRFQYVNGNAATFLEAVRRELADRFTFDGPYVDTCWKSTLGYQI